MILIQLRYCARAPSYKNLWHFLNIILGDSGVKALFESFLEKVRIKLKEYGIILGKWIGIDATPMSDLNWLNLRWMLL